MAHDFKGLKVTSFESRRSEEIKKLISYHNGVPRVAPSMKELPVDDSDSIWVFADRIFNNEIDITILLTGVGTTLLSDLLISKYGKKEFTGAITKTKIIARGPKPVAALRKYDLKPDITIPEPNTWRDILKTVDEELGSIAGLTIAVQEYGVSNTEFISELRNRGAEVLPVVIYKWGLPDDREPLRSAIRSISEGNEDVVLFTSSQQIANMIFVAKEEGMQESLYKGFGNVLVGSIGPSTTETLKSYEITADYEPDSPKMGNLVREMSRISPKLLKKKRTAAKNGVNTRNWKRVEMVWSTDNSYDPCGITRDSQFMKACRGEKTDFTPIWIMRQAGRFLREYRELRSRVSFLELCKTPELAAEVTLMAVDRLDVDAAIIFSDILLILECLGLNIEYSRNDGPIIKNIVRSTRTIDGLKEFDPEELEFVYNAIGITRRALDPEKALLGFAGAPFTVASYAIEGGSSRNYIHTKQLMYDDNAFWDEFMKILTAATANYLNRQIDAGADAVQIFDSWIGCLSPDDYKRHVFPHMKELVGMIKKDVPVILFGTGTACLLEMMRDTGCTVVGLDWRVDIGDARKMLGHDIPVQGNLDPVKLFSSSSYVKLEAEKILDKVNGAPGFIFNLGHGVLPKTPVDNVLKLVDTVHEQSSK